MDFPTFLLCSGGGAGTTSDTRGKRRRSLAAEHAQLVAELQELQCDSTITPTTPTCTSSIHLEEAHLVSSNQSPKIPSPTVQDPSRARIDAIRWLLSRLKH